MTGQPGAGSAGPDAGATLTPEGYRSRVVHDDMRAALAASGYSYERPDGVSVASITTLAP